MTTLSLSNIRSREEQGKEARCGRGDPALWPRPAMMALARGGTTSVDAAGMGSPPGVLEVLTSIVNKVTLNEN